jgi:hypothetical protein
MTHTNYTPNEYEQMLIAAGWITAESLDSEYQKYLASTVDLQRRFDEFEPMDYSAWKSMHEQWNQLDAAYKTEVQPHYDRHYDGNIPWQVRDREKQLLRDMDWIETNLGY